MTAYSLLSSIYCRKASLLEFVDLIFVRCLKEIRVMVDNKIFHASYSFVNEKMKKMKKLRSSVSV